MSPAPVLFVNIFAPHTAAVPEAVAFPLKQLVFQ